MKIKKVILRLAEFVIIALIFASGYILTRGFLNDEPDWLWLMPWCAFFPFAKIEGKKNAIFAPLFFYTWMMVLALLKAVVYREMVGEQNCLDTILYIAGINLIVIGTIPVFIRNKQEEG